MVLQRKGGKTAMAQEAKLLAQQEARRKKRSLSQMPCRVFRTDKKKSGEKLWHRKTAYTIFSSKKKEEKKQERGPNTGKATLSLVLRRGGGGGERAPGTHCLRMRVIIGKATW